MNEKEAIRQLNAFYNLLEDLKERKRHYEEQEKTHQGNLDSMENSPFPDIVEQQLRSMCYARGKRMAYRSATDEMMAIIKGKRS